jgi:hypothetical protein
MSPRRRNASTGWSTTPELLFSDYQDFHRWHGADGGDARARPLSPQLAPVTALATLDFIGHRHVSRRGDVHPALRPRPPGAHRGRLQRRHGVCPGQAGPGGPGSRMGSALGRRRCGELCDAPGLGRYAGTGTGLPSFAHLGPLLRTPLQGADTVVWLAAEWPEDAKIRRAAPPAPKEEGAPAASGSTDDAGASTTCRRRIAAPPTADATATALWDVVRRTDHSRRAPRLQR